MTKARLGWGLVFLLAVLAFQWGLWLMRQPSDLAVLVAIIFILGGFFYMGRSILKFTQTFLIILLAVYAAACTERIQPGHVGIVVNSWGSDRGVDDYPATTGRVWYNPFTTDVFQYPTFMQSTELAVRFNDKDGMNMGMKVGVGYTLISAHVPAFYVKFRSEDISTFTSGFFNNEAQAAFNAEAGKLSAEQIYSTEKEALLVRVKDRLNERMQAYGVKIEQFAIQGEVQLPPQITEALNAKIRATQDAQRVENELRTTQASAQKQVAQAEGEAKAWVARAEGTARANRTVQESLTPGVLEWKRLEIQQQQIEKWNGQMPSTVLGSSNQLVMPLRQ